MSAIKGELEKLATLLERRLEVIGDAEMREKDPGQQLKLLEAVSHEITALHSNLKGRIKPRLDHFLESCSYAKALDWVRDELAEG